MNQIRKDTDRDYFMSGQEAQEYGIVDHVIPTGMTWII
jgi:ATP-dependent Clp protease protease subunit